MSNQTRRDKSDAKFERTPMRIAFEKWRDIKYPVGNYWWNEWSNDAIDKDDWIAFMAGYEAATKV